MEVLDLGFLKFDKYDIDLFLINAKLRIQSASSDAKYFAENVASAAGHIHQINKEFITEVKQEIKNTNQEIKNDIKQEIYFKNEKLGKVIDDADKFVTTTINAIEGVCKVLKPGEAISLTKNKGMEIPYVPGNHIIATRVGYSHHGIYAGDNKVIHFQRGKIQMDTMEDFQLNPHLIIAKVCSAQLYTNEEIVKRARRRIGEMNYNLIFNNCQHFVDWCRNNNGNHTM